MKPEVTIPISVHSDAVDGNGTLSGVGVVDDQVPGTYTLTFDYAIVTATPPPP